MQNALYYRLKPFVPWFARMAVRRRLAVRKRRSCQTVWPINAAAAKPPQNWPGWPEGKKFALVLTHDVESAIGLEKCQQLAALEKQLGFRSSFNFIPEGSYSVTADLRHALTSQGFEVGVHDLKHDGKLYESRKSFSQNAQRINEYLREWGSVGFRGGFMHHNLNWLNDLEIEYDASTFDTDPFEPQPSGTGTIFPFVVPGPRGGYVELPYTLPQDSTLFLLFRERNTATWRMKLDWIARHGGMALVNVHPDYLSFNGAVSAREFSAEHYFEFLRYIRERYDGQFWHELPRGVARYAKRVLEPAAVSVAQSGILSKGHSAPAQRIWIDLDNTPHVPFFVPIIRELQKRGYEVHCTARDAFQVFELAQKKGLACRRVGHHYGKNRIAKLYGLFFRALQLLPFVLKQKPDLAVSHGSRSQVIICNFLRIPTVLLTDYEFAEYPPLMRPRWEMVPECIPNEGLACKSEFIRKYPGIKEDVYVPEFQPDPSLLKELGLLPDNIIVTVRPPATEAHYHNPESETLFFHLMEFLLAREKLQVVLLPRNARQADWIKSSHPNWFEAGRLIIPATAVDGLNLLFHSDLVVSGGGTMNREAAALGVPVYSIFRGEIGAVDRFLEKSGLLILLESTADINSKIELAHRKKLLISQTAASALASIVSHIEDVLSRETCGAPVPIQDHVSPPAANSLSIGERVG